MSKPLEATTLTLPNGTSSPEAISFASDPTAGAGFPAPVGSLGLRTDLPSIYCKTTAPDTGWTRVVPNQVIHYVATGAEGTDFFVTIPAPPPSTSYGLTWATEGVASVPVLDMPTGVGDRTVNHFRVVTANNLTVGDKLVFILTLS